MATFVLLRVLASVIPLAIGSALFAFSFANDWKGDMRILDRMVKTKERKQNRQADISKQVTEFIRTHSYVRQLSRTSNISFQSHW